MLPSVQQYLDALRDFSALPTERRSLLDALAEYIRSQTRSGQPARLTFICTHNSRRSHLGQVWAQAAAHYWGLAPVDAFSGGTETTACNPRTVAALQRAGIRVQQITDTANPVYLFQYAEGVPPLAAFSKVFDQAPNPQSGFAAVMTCTQAEENCPFVPGAARRFSLTYEDPKAADDTPAEAATYDERCRQIAQEMLYMMFRAREEEEE
ncbi:MAG: protein-tyrosine-phosphatase [Saprospiraceae bacterium]|nr:protein-tyrosine-phosphatase [Saprospiraceae bacterium]